MKILVPDDGLRCRRPGSIGTNKRYPCGHPRTAENTRISAGRSCCTLCRRRIERDRYHRAKAAESTTQASGTPA